MKIPSDAIIPREKLTHYLLVYRRKSDKSKFLSQAGFTQDNPDVLEAAIRQLIESHEVVFDTRDEYGDYYLVEGDLQGPDGTLMVITVWIVKTKIDDKFRFVTLKPRR